MKALLPAALLLASAGCLHASIIETISINLSDLHAGSTLSGEFTLPNTPMVGDTDTVTLYFSDPSDYSVSSVTTTITVGFGITEDTIRFSPIAFTNPTGNMFTKNVDLLSFVAARCASFPCTATGGFQDDDPASFRGTYTIAPASIPEPNFGWITPVLLVGLAIARRVIR
jgi:hypothetical protein